MGRSRVLIEKAEILEVATRVSLNPHVVEKDYVLGWLLAGINAHEELNASWIFKGGTCLKKCFFETYRFSEDLDFTLRDQTHIDEVFLKRVFAEIGRWVYDRTGIEIPADRQDFEILQNPRGNLSCQGKLSYRGPVSPQGRNMPRVKLDLTADERVVLAPVVANVFHPYGDAPEEGIQILAYAYVEAFAEKVRALAERTRPRDLYDVVNLFRNSDSLPTAPVMRDVLSQKCDFKGIALPKIEDLHAHRDGLAAGWSDMLAHQLPALLPLDSFWDELPAFFAWLAGGAAPATPGAYAVAAGETIIRDRFLGREFGDALQSHLEIIRFAAFNRMLVDLHYQGTIRRVEAYSLRRTRDGNVVLHAHNVDKNEHRSYRIDRITGATTTNEIFVPRHAIELSPQGPVAIPASTRTTSGGLSGGFVRSARAPLGRRATPAHYGPVYIYQCPLCQKKFRREKMDSRLNPHKNSYGMNCSGRTGYLVETK
jgi:predicted nucleotidyltransferase component of viral defense system